MLARAKPAQTRAGDPNLSAWTITCMIHNGRYNNGSNITLHINMGLHLGKLVKSTSSDLVDVEEGLVVPQQGQKIGL